MWEIQSQYVILKMDQETSGTYLQATQWIMNHDCATEHLSRQL